MKCALIRGCVRVWVAVAIVLVLSLALPAHAQSAITIVQAEHEHVFRDSITFRLLAKSAAKITSIKLFYRVSGQTSANKIVLTFDPDTTVQAEHIEDMAADDPYVPPMITFTYWWVIEDESGNRLKTEPTSFVYIDTGYTWQVLEDERVRLYWHDQDRGFGQDLFDLAVEAAADLSTEFGVTPNSPVAIVIYNSHTELMSALEDSSAEWIGAVNFSGKGCIAIGLGTRRWMEEVIPHELTHAMLDQIAQPPFGEIPRWLHEGLAVRSEGGMKLEERAALADAIRDDALISLRVLNSVFADQRDRAILSYAESNSLVNFIIDVYGTEKLGELIAVFAQGAHYDDAMTEVFGVDMDGMEDLWREHIGAPPRTGATRATPAPTATFTPASTLVQKPQETNTPVLAPVDTATAVAILPTSTATPLPDNSLSLTPVPTSRGPCLGAVPALALVALFVILRPRPTR
jgi:hypothetical protein